jgi:hypothetical protein
MDPIYRTAIWNQFGATIDMFEKAIRACPDDLWLETMWENHSDPPGFSQCWYIVYHTLFWLDLYLSGSVDGFFPPPPYALDELDPAGLLPDRVYSRDELLAYLEYCRQKCWSIVETLTDERATHLCKFRWGEISFVELLLYNTRHVQEHTAQLNLFLGKKTGWAPGWVTKARPVDFS